MSRQVTATLVLDFNFVSEDWGIDFESMSDADFRSFVTDQFWEVVGESGHLEPEIEEHTPYV
jgi:hypothetical protein